MRKPLKLFTLMILTAFIFTLSSLGTRVTALARQDMVLTEKNAETAEEDTKPLKLNVTDKSMVTGSTFVLKLYNMKETQKASFSSSDSSVVTVTSYGLLEAVKPESNQEATRSATITVTVKDSATGETVTLTCNVKVGPKLKSVKFADSEDGIELKVGDKKTPTVIKFPGNSVEQPTFLSTNTSVAKVSSKGTVTAKGEGTTYIIVQSEDHSFSLLKVVVTAAEGAEESVEPEFTTGASISVGSIETK